MSRRRIQIARHSGTSNGVGYSTGEALSDPRKVASSRLQNSRLRYGPYLSGSIETHVSSESQTDQNKYEQSIWRKCVSRASLGSLKRIATRIWNGDETRQGSQKTSKVVWERMKGEIHCAYEQLDVVLNGPCNTFGTFYST
jgi:hypothetical protein